MYCLSTIATIPLATGNKLNCFISARGMLTYLAPCSCVVVFSLIFLLIFYTLINYLLKKKRKKVNYVLYISYYPPALISLPLLPLNMATPPPSYPISVCFWLLYLCDSTPNSCTSKLLLITKINAGLLKIRT